MTVGLERPDLFLVARLLENLDRAGAPVRRTALQLTSAINYTQLERYLAFLEDRGLVVPVASEDGGAPLVALTPMGREALAYLARTIRDLLHSEFGRAALGR